MTTSESIECMKLLLAAERLLAESGDTMRLAHLSLAIDRVKETYPEAKQFADDDAYHAGLQWEEGQWGQRAA